jgi:hypothetical protein
MKELKDIPLHYDAAVSFRANRPTIIYSVQARNADSNDDWLEMFTGDFDWATRSIKQLRWENKQYQVGREYRLLRSLNE